LLLEERKIAVEDIVRVRPGYALYKTMKRHTPYCFLTSLRTCATSLPKKIAKLSEAALDVLFSLDIVEYVKSKVMPSKTLSRTMII